MFELYLRLGMEHIADLQGYDHILFIAMLCAVYTFAHWKKVLILVTAFTVGHSVTLALATLNIVRISVTWIEFLIPVTILFTALVNMISGVANSVPGRIKYVLALFFGLIHGLGFSTYLRSLLDARQSVAVPLLGFNVGVELGQLVIVLCVLTLTALLIHLFRVKHRDWILALSGAGAGISLVLLLERIPLT